MLAEKPIGVLHIDDVHFVAVAGYEGDALLVVDSLYLGEEQNAHRRCRSAKNLGKARARGGWSAMSSHSGDYFSIILSRQ